MMVTDWKIGVRFSAEVGIFTRVRNLKLKNVPIIFALSVHPYVSLSASAHVITAEWLNGFS
jgi:hypothetical protein